MRWKIEGSIEKIQNYFKIIRNLMKVCGIFLKESEIQRRIAFSIDKVQ